MNPFINIEGSEVHVGGDLILSTASDCNKDDDHGSSRSPFELTMGCKKTETKKDTTIGRDCSFVLKGISKTKYI